MRNSSEYASNARGRAQKKNKDLLLNAPEVKEERKRGDRKWSDQEITLRGVHLEARKEGVKMSH